MTSTINIEIWAHKNGRYGGFDGTDHVFIYSEEFDKQWKCFSSREYDRKDCNLILTANLPRDLFLQLMNEDDELGVRNQITGTCHTIANRALLLADDNLDVRDSGGDDISVVLFGKYGINTTSYKNNLKAHCNKLYGKKSIKILEEYYSKIDNCLDFEIESWICFISKNIKKYKDKIDSDFIEKMKEIQKEKFKSYLKNYIEQREIIDDKYHFKISDSPEAKAVYYNELWAACKYNIVEAITNEIIYDNKDILKNILSEALEKAFRQHCKI